MTRIETRRIRRAASHLVLPLAAALVTASCSGGGGGRGGPATDAPPPPELSALDPDRGPAGRSVTVRGIRFAAPHTANAVFFDSIRASTASGSASELVCTVPNGLSAGTVQVTVSTAGGTSNALPFTVEPAAPGGGVAPAVTALDPVAAAPGAALTISGAGFDPDPTANDVRVNGVAASVTSASATQLVVTVPPGSASGPVIVTTANGDSNGLTFYVTTDQPSGQGASGSQALALLRPSPGTHLVVEVDFVAGAAPDQSALDRLVQRIQERCGKPGGVALVLDDQIPDPGIDRFTIADVQALELANRDHYATATTPVLYVLYVDGAFEADTPSTFVLGVSYSGSAFCLFKDNIRRAATLFITLPVIERAVIVHELGHNLGLVDNGVPEQTPHEDPNAPAHDVSNACVMFAAIETNLISQVLGTVPDQFDANCIADLQAAGGR